MGAFFYCNKQIETSKIQKVFETRGHKKIQSDVKNGETLVYAGKILTEEAKIGRASCRERV